MSPREILNRARGFQPWPGAYGFLRGQRFHVWRGAIAEKTLAPGTLLGEGKRMFAGCGGGAIELLEIQMEGKKRMATAAFLNGFSITPGEILG
jgi:methionyl-tRNA formyltransferase